VRPQTAHTAQTA